MMSATELSRGEPSPNAPYFPSEKKVPESKRHLELRTTLYRILKLVFGDEAAVGCDQFVYWDPTDPTACLAPDGFVRLGSKDELFESWKVWERGAPHVAVEILSRSDAVPDAWEEKFEKYRRLGIRELVRFDFRVAAAPLTVWDDAGGALVVRELADPRRATSLLPGLDWVVVDDSRLGVVLRVFDRERQELVPTPEEQAAEARLEAESERDRALARVRELEEALKRRG